MMPEMDGKKAVKRVRGLEESWGVPSMDGVKIIMATASYDISRVIRSFKELCGAYLFKPVDAGKLLHELRTLQLIQNP
jgi:CheY-like chemotaxis protein